MDQVWRLSCETWDAKGERHRGTRDTTWVGKSSLYQEEPSWKFLQFGIKGIPHLSVRKDRSSNVVLSKIICVIYMSFYYRLYYYCMLP